MADPVTVGLMIGSSVLSYASQSSAANAQNAANAQAARTAQQSYENEVEAIEARRTQEFEASSQALQQSQLQAMRERAKVQVASGEAGISGLSLDALMQDINMAQGQNIVTSNRNYINISEQLDRDRRAAAATGQSRINSLTPAQGPSLVGHLAGTGAQIAESKAGQNLWDKYKG